MAKVQWWQLLVSVVFVIAYLIIIRSIILTESNNFESSKHIRQLTTKLASLENQSRSTNLPVVAEVTGIDSNSMYQSMKVELALLRSKIDKTPTAPPKSTINENRYIPGVIILGMHRSGTSVVGGVMNKMGLNTGGPLIQPAEDNAKGFFERIDVVLQNDEIMKKQEDLESGIKELSTRMEKMDLLE